MRRLGVSGPTSRYYKEKRQCCGGFLHRHQPWKRDHCLGKSGDDSDDFSISTTGELTFSSPPNFESPDDTGTDNVYQVTVEASDGTDTGSLAMTITVTNEDEPGSLALPFEQPEVGIELDALLADLDGTVSGETWKWESSSDGQTNWDTISGAASASYTPVAADVGRYLRVTAAYTDPQGPGKTAEAGRMERCWRSPTAHRSSRLRPPAARCLRTPLRAGTLEPRYRH